MIDEKDEPVDANQDEREEREETGQEAATPNAGAEGKVSDNELDEAAGGWRSYM